MVEKKTFFSVISGKVYVVDADEVKNLDAYQIPVLGVPKAACKKCYGRGYIGRDSKLKYYLMCPCLRKKVDFDNIKQTITVKD